MRRVEVDAERIDTATAITCGLRTNWIDGEGGDVEFSLDVGAGLGSPWMLLTVRKDGRRITERVDARAFLPAWVNAVVADLDRGEGES